MKLINHEYHIEKHTMDEAGIIIFNFENDIAVCAMTIILDKETKEVESITRSFNLKNHFMKGIVADEGSSYGYYGGLCRETSADVIASLREADAVVDDLREFKRLFVEAPEKLKLDICKTHHAKTKKDED